MIGKKGVVLYIAILNCEITALVNHGQRLLRVSFIVDKLLCVIILADEFINVFIVFGEQSDEILGCAGGEPVIV